MKKYINKKTGETITSDIIIANIVSYIIIELFLILFMLDCINKI